jgi:two-component system heavy metal sensor histidine kinase CusS
VSGRGGLSLTLRLALFYAASTLAVLCAVGFYVLHLIDGHFIEQDVAEMRGKLELSARLIAKASADGAQDELPFHLDDALVGHHHLTLAVFVGGRRWYANGHGTIPAALPEAAADRPEAARLLSWRDGGDTYRELALRLDSGPVIAVAVDTRHHAEFMATFQIALWGMIALAALAAAVLGWGAARAGLAPLRQIAQLAGRISAEQLAERLPADRVPPELRELAASFNAMLDRLGESIERLSGFAADLAHEMRTPVSNLMMQTQVTLGRARDVDDYREVLASNLEEYERLARTIGDMLFIAKADNGMMVPSREEVDLAAEIGGVFEFFEALAEDGGVRLTLAGNARVDGDRLMLRRAIANLVSNAIRHTAPGGNVEVSIYREDGGTTHVAVHNPCTPPPPEILARLFDRFYRADPARREHPDGSGLGLAITRAIARAHGGDVTVSATADGLCFELWLPAT